MYIKMDYGILTLIVVYFIMFLTERISGNGIGVEEQKDRRQ